MRQDLIAEGRLLRNVVDALRLALDERSDGCLEVTLWRGVEACSVPRMSFNRRPSFAGIVQVSRRSGVGSRASGQGGQRSIASCAISSDA